MLSIFANSEHIHVVHDMQLCKLGCGRKVIGYEVEQHYGGKPIKFCRDTNEWLDSMCPEREVPCIYIISQPRETALEPGQEDPDEKRKYVERGGDFATKHSDWCRKPLPLDVYEQNAPVGSANLH